MVQGEKSRSQFRNCVSLRGVPRFHSGLHAWNAVQLEGHWYLVDATWSEEGTDTWAASVEETGKPEGERTGNGDWAPRMWLTSPAICVHLPKEPLWQLLEIPFTYKEWLDRAAQAAERPITTPAFRELGMDLVSHASSHTISIKSGILYILLQVRTALETTKLSYACTNQPL